MMRPTVAYLSKKEKASPYPYVEYRVKGRRVGI